METRKQKRRSLRLTLLLLLLTAIILLSSSYAWFTANQQVTVSQLEVNVAAQNGLQISADGSIFSAMINANDLTTAAATYTETLINQLPTSLAPVSTGGNVTDGLLDMYLGTVNADEKTGAYKLTAIKQTEATGTQGSFIAFDMFLKVEATTEIQLTGNSGVKASGASTGIENASRIAFVVQGNQPAGTGLDTIQKLKGGQVYIWEPNYDTHTPAALSHAIGSYGKTLADFKDGLTSMPTAPIVDGKLVSCDGVIDTITEGILLPNTTAAANADKFKTVTPSYTTKSSFSGNDTQQIFTLNPGITKIRVYFWIEGQDYDCENDASGGNIALNLQISRVATGG